MPSSSSAPSTSSPSGSGGDDLTWAGAAAERRARLARLTRVSGATEAFNRLYTPNNGARQPDNPAGSEQTSITAVPTPQSGLAQDSTAQLSSSVAVSATASSSVPSTNSDRHEHSSAPPLNPPVVATGNDSNEKYDNISSSDKHGDGAQPVEPLSMERVRDGPSAGLTSVPGSGLHMPPEVLGHSSPRQHEPIHQLRRPSALADLNIQARKRSIRAIKSTKSQAAAAAAAEVVSSIRPFKEHILDGHSQQPTQLDASMFTMMTHQGMEVAFVLTGNKLVGVCSRTQMFFQTLNLASYDSPVVSLTSNSLSGMLVVAHQNGKIQTYTPVETDLLDPESGLSESKEHHPSPASVFGRFRWVNNLTLETNQIFYNTDETPNFQDRRTGRPGDLVDVSTSYDQKILVAHRNQLAVFDAIPSDNEATNGLSDDDKLLWTVVLPSNVIMAKLSGDGQAIAVVVSGDNADAGDHESGCGVRTFVHDTEDGSNPVGRPQLARKSSVGILYKPGIFLKHSAPVTRISFRGLGHVTSDADAVDEDQGNDLLLTQSAQDSTVRIFNQNGWKQLMSWTTPPNSRADWIRGSSAFSLGDLESQKKIRSGSRPPSRHVSTASLPELANDATAMNNGFMGARPMATHPAPSSAAGAWIAELTFRNAFPALRLSRLSYMKRGNDDSQPAHFESVAAILPAGSIVQASVLHSDDMGLSVQGVWPAWNPWLSETTDAESSDTLSGSAMTFLGLSSVPPPASSYFGESNLLGGTHSPPNELRIAASHPLSGKLVLMDFPLWGDEDFGAMELGSPLRSVLSVSDMPSSVESYDQPATNIKDTSRGFNSISMDYESNRLCAKIDAGARSISVSWRKQGTMSLYSQAMTLEEGIPHTGIHDVPEPSIAEVFHDVSCVPVPLDLPPLRLPRGTGTVNNDKIIAVKWWPDDSFGGPPLVLALTKSSTMILFEIPPPWCALEPAMPDFDPFGGGASACGSPSESLDVPLQEMSASEEDEFLSRQEYDVMVTPHPDFGLGLRLESPMDGLPAVAGSFKKHPLNGGMLPAEKTGMIILGDELLSVNNVSLENMTFDDIIATVRHVGADSGPGEPLCLRFRPVPPDGAGRRRRTTGSFVFHEAAATTASNAQGIVEGGTVEANASNVTDSASGRRNVIGVNPKTALKRNSGSFTHRRTASDTESLASLLVGSFAEAQQEFGRVIAVIRKAVPLEVEGVDDSEDVTRSATQDRLLVIPWTSGTGTPSPTTHRGAALVLAATGSNLQAKRLELPLRCDGEKARILDLGSVCIQEGGDDIDSKEKIEIRKLEVVETVGENRCFALLDNLGSVRLVFLTVHEKAKNSANAGTREAWAATEPTLFVASFRQYKIFEVGGDSRFECQLRASSVGLLATSNQTACQSIKVWCARPDPSSREIKSPAVATDDDYFGQDYYCEDLYVESSSGNVKDSEILDFCFVRTGYLDSFPGLVVFLRSEAVIYQRRGGSLHWKPIIRLTYSSIPESMMTSTLIPSGDSRQIAVAANVNPRDAFPHILPALRAALASSYDESHYLRSDWHPESLLAHVCTEPRGPKFALKRYIRGVFLWLSEDMGGSVDDSTTAAFPRIVPVDVATGKHFSHDNEIEDEVPETSASAFSLMTSLSGAPNKRTTFAESKELSQLKDLHRALGNPRYYRESVNTRGKSREFKLAMNRNEVKEDGNDDESILPIMLSLMRSNELRVLWAICDVLVHPPNFRGLDKQGELAMLVHAIHASLKKGPKIEDDLTVKHASSRMLEETSFLVKRQSKMMHDEKEKLPPPSASAGCVAALMSDCQGCLLENLRIPGEKLDWETVRAMRLPFWLRSDEKLREISEEIGQKLYKDTRDILRSAIFFIVAGKHRTLKNLANADGTDSGRKFFKFLTDHDFKTQRGRRAAEKNAFSLLRKNRYESASAFFLLADPPLLNFAVDTIVTKMEDLELAFLVARLAESSCRKGSSSIGFHSEGYGASLAGFGGGGGFAGSGISGLEPTSKDSDCFKDWKPKLSKGAVHLLVDRGLPLSSNDSCLSAVQLLWLGKREEASNWLSGFLADTGGLRPSFQMDMEVPRLDAPPRNSKSKDVVVATTNAMINFMSGPSLLKAMNASSRTTFASALLVSNSLSKVGIEVPSMRSIIQNADPGDLNDAKKSIESETDGATANSSQNVSSNMGQPQSSIFDDFDTPRVKPTSGGQMNGHSTSIFDDFDARPSKVTTTSPSGQMASSIFDGFDAPPAKNTQASAAPASGEMASSIFDGFDAPPAAKKPTANASPSGQMTSSIFDGFDAPPPTKKPITNASPGGQMTSSIFDGFDAPPAAKPPTTNASPSGQMTSSIFDGFDAPPAAKPPTTNASPSGQMTSSIFDGFDSGPKGQNPLHSGNEQRKDQDDKANASPGDAGVTNEKPEELSPPRETPLLWLEWRKNLLIDATAKRLIRELASLASRFHGDVFEPSIELSNFRRSPLIPSNASQVLQFHCEGEALLGEIRHCLDTSCESNNLNRESVVDHALCLLSSTVLCHRVSFAVLLHLALNRVDLAEDIVRNTSQSLIQRCSALSFSNDEIIHSRLSAANLSTLHVRRLAAQLSWQLELCLWMHRGGALPLTGIALNEAIVAVRVGLLVASWNRDFECMETMIRQPPDCLVDHETGRQLWTSLKIISSSTEGDKKVGGTSSGGWEFLVDCRRAEATELLRPRQTGCFIIRPHPDDHGVFTLSFKTNLVPTADADSDKEQTSSEAAQNNQGDQNNSKKRASKASSARPVRKDDVVQHAIIRLSDSGFRCGSFGPFATLMKLLEAVSSSLPFDLRFDQPPTEGVIKEEGSKPSPNSAFFRKLSLCQAEHAAPGSSLDDFSGEDSSNESEQDSHGPESSEHKAAKAIEKEKLGAQRRKRFGSFFELLVLSEIRKQLSCIAAAHYECSEPGWTDVDSVGSVSDSLSQGAEQQYAAAARILRPLLTWSRMVEVGILSDLAPRLKDVCPGTAFLPVALNASETAIEISTTEASSGVHGGDAVIRRMIQPGSGVEFRTLRLGDGGESAMVVLFSKKDAIQWFISSGTEKSQEDALNRLAMMENSRVIETVDLTELGSKAYRKAKVDSQAGELLGYSPDTGKGVRYRFVDPWEVEPLDSREAETRGASLGRHRFLAFSLGSIASSCEDVFRSIGGLHLLELWSTAKGGVALTKAIASVHPPWERGVGGDLQLIDGLVTEPVPYVNSIRQHLYRNALFRRLSLPQRFLALIQVELLDLKNLTSPGGSLSLSVYALLRLKRSKSGAPLTVKARTLDSVATHPMKLGKSSGPNAPASWGSLVRFRFPLPEYTGPDGRSLDGDREALFKGPPSILQVSVYEKKFMSDTFLGGADVKLDGLSSGGQLEEWVPLRTESDGINWFARIRLTLRFELMCLSSEHDLAESIGELAPSVGLKRIRQLSSGGGAQEDLQKSVSTPDLLSYFESIVY